MLHDISWTQFSELVAGFTVCWYAYVFLRYRNDLLKRGQQVNIFPAVEAGPVIGAIKEDRDTYLEDPANLIFSGEIISDDISPVTTLPGPAEELLGEAEMLVDAFSENEDKSEFLSLLQLLISKYVAYQRQIDLPEVIATLQKSAKDKLPFSLMAAEWPQTF